VEHRVVEVERASADETVVRGGVSPGEKVVTDGQLRLASGSLVKIRRLLRSNTEQDPCGLALFSDAGNQAGEL